MNPSERDIAVRELAEERLSQIDAAPNATHAFFHHDGLRGFTRRGVVDRQRLAAVEVVVALGAHELVWQRDAVASWVDVNTAGAETASVVGDVALAGGALALTGCVVRCGGRSAYTGIFDEAGRAGNGSSGGRGERCGRNGGWGHGGGGAAAGWNEEARGARVRYG